MSDPWSPEFEISVASNDTKVVQIETIELHHSSFVDENGQPTPIRAVNDVVDWTLTLEAGAPMNGGEAVHFNAIPFLWSPPDFGPGMVPQAELRVDNIGGEVPQHMDQAEVSFEAIIVVHRCYLSTRPTIVDMGPFVFKMKQVGEDNQAASGKVELAALQNMQFGTRTYESRYFRALTEFS